MTRPMDPEPPMQALQTMTDRIRHHDAQLRGFLERRAPGHGEELAQEVWLRVARAAPDCPTDAAFRAYAFAVARRLLIDHHRRRSARVQLVPLEGGMDPRGHDRPDGALAAAEVLAVVEATLEAMKPELAEVFRLRTTTELSFKDIAARQGVSINTALGRMHQAVGKLHAALAARDHLPEAPEPSVPTRGVTP
ncbi:MAG: RNA polymerase sigma factor [Alphaproteobacteria bacterium]|nr:RNA polymerase sigma factor [Alphaproteobacteria bacterium]